MPICNIVKRGLEYVMVIPPEFKSYSNALLEWCYKNRAGVVSVTLSPPKKPRTTGRFSQNNHFKGHVRQISVETQNSFSAVEYAILQRALEHGYPQECDSGGNLLFDLLGNPSPLNQKDASSEDFSILIETAHVIADELQIRLVEE